MFYFDYLKPIESKKVCVKSCPDRYISNIEDYKNYSKHNFFSKKNGACRRLEVKFPAPFAQLDWRKFYVVITLLRSGKTLTFAQKYLCKKKQIWAEP